MNLINVRAVLLAFLVLIVALLGLTACHSRSSLALEHKDAVVGKTQHDLISCAGVPIREYKSQEVTFLTYITIESAGARFDTCEATVSLRDDRVVDAKYKTTASRTYFGDCEPIFRGCASR